VIDDIMADFAAISLIHRPLASSVMVRVVERVRMAMLTFFGASFLCSAFPTECFPYNSDCAYPYILIYRILLHDIKRQHVQGGLQGNGQ